MSALQIVKRAAEMRAWSEAQGTGRTVALVPTMGALHAGHLSLVAKAREHAKRVVASIFVNPTQFGPGEDFEAYPRDLPGDLERLAEAGVDVVFTPQTDDVYPAGDCTFVEVERLGEGLCGAVRPGHFRGVTTVVTRLFCIVRPHVAVFGRKDFQQLAIIRRMTRDLHLGVEIVGAPIVREPDGLAMSSRNVYLTPEERRQAVVLSEALREAETSVSKGILEAERLIGEARARIDAAPLARPEYVELRDAETLKPRSRVDAPVVLAVAARFGRARLIDNALLSPDGGPALA